MGAGGTQCVGCTAPFYFIFNIIKEVIETSPDFGNAKNLIFKGWMAVLFAVVGYLLYIAALMCSHMAAFRVATNMRKDVLSHLVKLPLGYVEEAGSGRLRKIINDSTAASETYLAHQLPDKAVAVATPMGLIALLFIFDWKLGLLSLIPVGACISYYGKHDRKENGTEDERISEFT